MWKYKECEELLSKFMCNNLVKIWRKALHVQCDFLEDPKSSLDFQHDKIGNPHNGVMPKAQEYRQRNVGHNQAIAGNHGSQQIWEYELCIRKETKLKMNKIKVINNTRLMPFSLEIRQKKKWSGAGTARRKLQKTMVRPPIYVSSCREKTLKSSHRRDRNGR